MGWTGLLFSFAGRAAPLSALLGCWVITVEGAGIFCAYIVFDTWRILNQMNCDDYVQDTASAAALTLRSATLCNASCTDSGQCRWAKGAIQLYLDIVNLFLCDFRVHASVAADLRRPQVHPRDNGEDCSL